MKKKLNETHPEICKSWHPTKNTLKPSDVSYGSKKIIWWICSEGHEYDSPVWIHVKWSGCPLCSGQRVIPSTSLAAKRPEIAAQWHPTLNELSSNEVTEFSAKKIWWLDEYNHVWEARVFSRAQGVGCPICSNRKAGEDNCLAVTNPELAKEWHPTLNGDLTPKDFVAGSGEKAWWLCPNNPLHIWMAIIQHRHNGGRDGKGTGCPYCSKQAVDITNSLLTTHPEIAKQWHPTKNGSLTPSDVVAGSGQKVWWICDKAADHEWKTSICSRVNNGITSPNGSKCPCCQGRKVVLSNCLFTTHPKIAQEWHPTKNDITPYQVTYATNKSCWWICSDNPKHIWKARIDRRTSGTGCPHCASSKGEKKIKEILDAKRIKYKQQYRFPDCKNIRTLPFDFAILNEGEVIGVVEFQGRQHYQPISYFSGDTGHQLTRKTDKIKLDYCTAQKIPFLSIPFWNLDVIEHNLINFIKLLFH